MPITRKRKSQNPETGDANPNPGTNTPQTETSKMMSQYEKAREERIKENLERMQKLGLRDLSLKLQSFAALPKRTPRNTKSSVKEPSPLPPSGPLRRSTRLQNATPVSYSEATVAKKDRLLEDEDIRVEVGSKHEVYTEEHQKLLGNTERSWTLFVDGYGKDGKRIYDQIKGKTCHQCRQKTLGYHTHCCKCQVVQGQFCGDCLYMRYGEHVLEALENPNWICPVCRGICNCSLCRNAKGWAPTGMLYRKISNMGYKSVAHYLIQTRRQSQVTEASNSGYQASAKRSLPFSDMKAVHEGSSLIDCEKVGPLNPPSGDKLDDESSMEKDKQMPSIEKPATDSGAKRSLHFSLAWSNVTKSAETNLDVDETLESSNPKCEGHELCGFQSEGEENLHSEEHHDNNIPRESSSKLGKESALPNSSTPDSVAARLRQRRRMANDCDEAELTGVTKKISVDEQTVNFVSADVQEAPKLEVEDDENADRSIATENTKKLKKRSAHAAEPSPDSIGARLRRRRMEGKGQGSEELHGTNGQNSDRQSSEDITSVGKELGDSVKVVALLGEDSIARRLRPSHETT